MPDADASLTAKVEISGLNEFSDRFTIHLHSFQTGHVFPCLSSFFPVFFVLFTNPSLRMCCFEVRRLMPRAMSLSQILAFSV